MPRESPFPRVIIILTQITGKENIAAHERGRQNLTKDNNLLNNTDSFKST